MIKEIRIKGQIQLIREWFNELWRAQKVIYPGSRMVILVERNVTKDSSIRMKMSEEVHYLTVLNPLRQYPRIVNVWYLSHIVDIEVKFVRR